MKVYYILSIFTDDEKNLLLDSIKDLKNSDDIDEIIKTKYYRVNKETYNTTMNSIILETWMFIKTIWEKYWVKPTDINWVYKQNMVILNDDLWLFENNNWVKVSWDKNTYFFTSRYWFMNIFWAFWEELSKTNPDFPKLVFPNKYLINVRKEKIRFIMNAYEKRKEIIWNFMLPLMYTRSTESIKNLILLWNNEVWVKDIVIKKSRATDNGKDITLLNIDEYLKDDQKIDYLFLKYISKTSEWDSGIYFTSHFDIDKEFRFYYSIDNNTWKYRLYSIKEKVNLTQKEELLNKTTLSTWHNLRVRWNLLEKKDIDEKLLKMAEYILKKNKIEVWVIEFVKLKNGEYRFLEINCLWWSMMFDWKDEEDIKDHISNWWNYLYKKNIK